MESLNIPLICRKYTFRLFFLTCVSMSLNNQSLLLELVLLLPMLSHTTKSISWLLSGILCEIFFWIFILSSVMVFRSTASIWSVEKSWIISGVLFFGLSEAFSLYMRFRFSVPAKFLWTLTVSSQFETITFLDGLFSIATNWSFACQKTGLFCITNDYYSAFHFFFLFLFFFFLLNKGVGKRRDVFIALVLIIYFSLRLLDKDKLFTKHIFIELIPSSIQYFFLNCF